jgi:hypothetical protein
MEATKLNVIAINSAPANFLTGEFGESLGLDAAGLKDLRKGPSRVHSRVAIGLRR